MRPGPAFRRAHEGAGGVACSTPGDALGMRGTGSHDVERSRALFVPDAAVALKRKAGEWHRCSRSSPRIAFPLVYCGLSRRGRKRARHRRRPRRGAAPRCEAHAACAGGMDTALRAARLAHAAMVARHRAQPIRPRTASTSHDRQALVRSTRSARGAGDGTGRRCRLLPRERAWNGCSATSRARATTP